MMKLEIDWQIFRQMIPMEANAVYYLDNEETITMMILKNGVCLTCIHKKQGGFADDIFQQDYLKKAIRVERVIDDSPVMTEFVDEQA